MSECCPIRVEIGIPNRIEVEIKTAQITIIEGASVEQDGSVLYVR